MHSIQDFLATFGGFLNNVIIPLLFAVALLFFLTNAVRYFIIEGTDPQGREKAKSLALYGVIAFVILVGLWSIVNIILKGFELNRGNYVCPDYLPADKCGIQTQLRSGTYNNSLESSEQRELFNFINTQLTD